MMANGDETRGPEAVLQMLHYFYHVAFDAHAETTNEIVSDGKGMLEGYVVGKHIGEFAGIPATNKEFRVPICIAYDVEDEQIKRARVYFEIPVLMAQLGVGA
jgi:predicted ester cyclase